MKKLVWKVLKHNRHGTFKRNKKLSRMMHIMRKYHIYHFFKKYSRIINIEREIREKGNIEGAYLLLKRYKNRLKIFDQALSLLSKNKVSVTEFNELKESVDKNRAVILFKDMQILFDTTVKRFYEDIKRERETFKRLVNQNQQKKKD